MKLSPQAARIAFLLFFVHLLHFVSPARAGAPFRTLDPIPVAYGHWKIYLGTQMTFLTNRVVGAAPYFQANYGLLPDVQVQGIVPITFNHNHGEPTRYGLGDLEFGVKYRFITETKFRPQVAIYPIVTTPTGNPPVNLGTGNVRMIYPLVLGKTFGPWLTYGFAGYWIILPETEMNFWAFGWLLQRTFTRYLTLGTEFILNGPTPAGRASEIAFGIGTAINFNDYHHLLLAWDRYIHGPTVQRAYAAYQLTF